MNDTPSDSGSGGPLRTVRDVSRGNGPNRIWSITWNNYPDEWDDDVRLLSDEIQYAVFGREVAPTTNTPHLQGAVRFKRPKRAAGVRKMFPGCHIEFCRNPAKLYEYCKKEGNFVEFGRLQKQGARNDLTPFYDRIRGGDPIANLFEDFPAQTLRYLGNIDKIRLRFGGQTRDKPHVTWIHGATGVGKTRLVHEREPSVWTSTNDLKWFDGYEQHDAVLFDDFRPRDVSYGFLLRLLDRYPLNVPIKGGFVPWVPARIYVTAPIDPERMYLELEEDVAQLTRRIDEVIHLE